MPRDEFFSDVRRAVSFMAPRVEADTPMLDTAYMTRVLAGTDLWLAKGTVSAYKTQDFLDLPAPIQTELNEAVTKFRAVAASVNPQGPATAAQRNSGAKLFARVVGIVQSVVLDEWKTAASEVVGEAEKWAKELEWPTRRFAKTIVDDFIGKYDLETLVFAVEGSQIALVPVGRFAPGTDGMFDLAVMPAYDSVMVVRKNAKWSIYPLPDEERIKPWSKSSFSSTSSKLARLP